MVDVLETTVEREKEKERKNNKGLIVMLCESLEGRTSRRLVKVERNTVSNGISR